MVECNRRFYPSNNDSFSNLLGVLPVFWVKNFLFIFRNPKSQINIKFIRQLSLKTSSVGLPKIRAAPRTCGGKYIFSLNFLVTFFFKKKSDSGLQGRIAPSMYYGDTSSTNFDPAFPIIFSLKL